MNIEDFTKSIKTHAKKVINEDSTLNEEATKHSLILPLLDILEYNVFDRKELLPEVVADVGAK